MVTKRGQHYLHSYDYFSVLYHLISLSRDNRRCASFHKQGGQAFSSFQIDTKGVRRKRKAPFPIIFRGSFSQAVIGR